MTSGGNADQANSDIDNLGDICDNCVMIATPRQVVTDGECRPDGDAMGDACDIDDDADLVNDDMPDIDDDGDGLIEIRYISPAQ